MNLSKGSNFKRTTTREHSQTEAAMPCTSGAHLLENSGAGAKELKHQTCQNGPSATPWNWQKGFQTRTESTKQEVHNTPKQISPAAKADFIPSPHSGKFRGYSETPQGRPAELLPRSSLGSVRMTTPTSLCFMEHWLVSHRGG